MNYDDEPFTRTATISQQAVDAVMGVLQAHTGNNIDRLSVLAIVAHHLMEAQQMDTFESITYDGRGIRFVCSTPPQPKPTIH